MSPSSSSLCSCSSSRLSLATPLPRRYLRRHTRKRSTFSPVVVSTLLRLMGAGPRSPESLVVAGPPRKPNQVRSSGSNHQRAHFSVDEVHTEFAADDPGFDPYSHGPAHGLVHNTLLALEGKKLSNSERLDAVVSAMEAEAKARRVGLTLGDEKGVVLEEAAWGRYRREVEARLSRSGSDAGGDEGSKILAPTAADATCFVPDWEFNILEFGAHVGDGTLRLLTSIMRSEAVMPSALNVISTEDNESWQVEGTKLVRKALKFAEEKIPPCVSSIERVAEKTPKTAAQDSTRTPMKSKSRDLRDIVLYNPLQFGGGGGPTTGDDLGFATIARAIHAHVDDGKFDVLVFDHDPPERFLGDLQVMLRHDMLKDGAVVVIDNMLRHRVELTEFREWMDGSTFFAVESFPVQAPYKDEIYVCAFNKAEFLASAEGRKLRAEEEL